MHITKVETFLLTWPLDELLWASTVPMKAVNEVITKVYTNQGLVGVGQAHGPSVGTSGGIVQLALQPLVLGEDPVTVERLWQRMFALICGRDALGAGWSRPQMMAAIAAVDTEIRDIMGQALGLPVAKLLGGYTDKVRGYATGGYSHEGKTAADLGREVSRYVELGYTAVKLKAGGLTLTGATGKLLHVAREHARLFAPLRVTAEKAAQSDSG